ncbi:MAG: adenylate/guanylate cyclase domain-containing protein [Chthoniobacterales bacterium]
MKRALLGTVWIGAIAAGLGIGLQISGLLARPAAALARAHVLPPNDAAGLGSFLFLILLSFAVAWTMAQVAGLARQLGLFLLLIVELIAAAWVLQWMQISFPPLPSISAALGAALLALGLDATGDGRRRRFAARAIAGRLGQPGVDRLTESDPGALAEPSAREASAVFCEIANEAELIDELPAAACAQLTVEFIACARQCFLREGGYLQAADGEGIRVLFGFPNPSPQHAVEAARAALAFREELQAAAATRPESLGKVDLRIGISSGTVVVSLPEDGASGDFLIAGEPFEVARRLARANQIYGSEILLGPRTYSAAGKGIVARPIDFLRSAALHDRLEIYELLALAEKATVEEVARRDRFWTGIVYFRERRWNEAWTEFDRARTENGAPDRPLQWYLRRLEPLCLQMSTEPAPAAEPLVPL